MSWRAALLGALAGFALSSCGDVYEELAPAQKRAVEMLFVPDFVRVGGTGVRLAAFVDIPKENSFVTELELGSGVQVLGFDSQPDNACRGIPVPEQLAEREPFLLCISLSVDAEATLGERRAKLELRSDGEPILAAATFFVLRQIE